MEAALRGQWDRDLRETQTDLIHVLCECCPAGRSGGDGAGNDVYQNQQGDLAAAVLVQVQEGSSRFFERVVLDLTEENGLRQFGLDRKRAVNRSRWEH